MDRLCSLPIVYPGLPQIVENAAAYGGISCPLRALPPNAGYQIFPSWRNTGIVSRTRALLMSPVYVHSCTSKSFRSRQRKALSSDSTEYTDSSNCNGIAKAAIETVGSVHDDDTRPVGEEYAPIDSSGEQSSLSFAGDIRDVERLTSYTTPTASNSSQQLNGNEFISKRSTSAEGGSEESLYSSTRDFEHMKPPKAPAVESNGSLSDGFQGRDTEFMESKKPSYLSLVWEAGSKIEGVTSDMDFTQNGSEPVEQNLSLVVNDSYRANEDETMLYCFLIWSRDSAKHISSWAQNIVNSVLFSLWSQNKRWKAFWKQALLEAQILRRISEAKAVWSNLGGAIQETSWLPRADDAFDMFFRNLSEIQKNILLMTAVQGKLAWIRLQQHYFRKLMELEEILATFPKTEQELNARETELLAYTDKLLTQSTMNQEAYASSQEALSTAEDMVSQLQTQVDQLEEDVTSRDTLLRLLQKEGVLSNQSLQRAAQSLSDAERRIVELERRVQIGEDSLYKERDKLTTALRSAGLQEHALKVAELKAAELTSEITELKESVGTGREAEQLRAHVKNLEQELKTRDLLLLEIKEETIRSTEALKLAARIKQDLNATRQRELQLTLSLESANEMIKELQKELTQNVRALRAEEVLKHTEKKLSDARTEVEFLRNGVDARDQAINIMKDEVDMNIDLLSHAARDREELRHMSRYVWELKTELESRDAKLSMMREEMALVINLAKQQQTPGRGISSSQTVPPSPASSAPSPVQDAKPKRKTPARKQTGTSTTRVRKPTGSRKTPRSPPRAT